MKTKNRQATRFCGCSPSDSWAGRYCPASSPTGWCISISPATPAIASGAPLFITQGAVFAGLTIIGLIAAVGRIFDAVTDPWIASCSDRCRNKLGRRIPFPAVQRRTAGHRHRAGVHLPGGGQSPKNAFSCW
jgi:hypothetical protein